MSERDAAEARVSEARKRLSGTVGALQTRLDPRTLASEAVDTLAGSGERAVRTGVATARRNPAAVAGAVGVALLWFGRKRIRGLFTRAPTKPPLLTKPVAIQDVSSPSSRLNRGKRTVI